MKYGPNKQFKILKYIAAAAPCEIIEGTHQQTKRNAEDYPYYALMAIESMSNNFQN